MKDDFFEDIKERLFYSIISILFIFKFAFAAGYRYCEGKRLKDEG